MDYGVGETGIITKIRQKGYKISFFNKDTTIRLNLYGWTWPFCSVRPIKKRMILFPKRGK